MYIIVVIVIIIIIVVVIIIKIYMTSYFYSKVVPAVINKTSSWIFISVSLMANL